MVFSFDDMVWTLVLLLPGFLAVSSGVLVVKAWKPIDVGTPALVLFSLAAAVPVHLILAALSSIHALAILEGLSPPSGQEVLSLDYLASLALAFLFSVLIGLVVGPLFEFTRVRLRRLVQWACDKYDLAYGARESHQVWTAMVVERIEEASAEAPLVAVILERVAYVGQAVRLPTQSDDRHIMLAAPQTARVESDGQPQWDELSDLGVPYAILDRTAASQVLLLAGEET